MAVLYQNNPTQSFYGHSIGILVLDVAYPCVPGNVNNATTFEFPVRYKVVKNVTSGKLIYRENSDLIQPFIDAAKELQDEGVQAITGACGFMALFQKEVAAELDTPVFLSSLLQIPFIYQMLGMKKTIGVISADASVLTDDFFKSVGVLENTKLAIAGMEDKPEFVGSILKRKGSLDSEVIKEEALDVARELKQNNDDLGAILLECSDLPPYTHAIQEEVNLPVFDYVSMINYVYSAMVKRPYLGYL